MLPKNVAGLNKKEAKKMIIIAFSNKTSKTVPNILCHRFKHVAPIVPYDDKLIMYQFVTRKRIEKIVLRMRDIRILRTHGWEFIYIDGIVPPYDFNPYDARTCVDLSKRAIGMRKWRIQTPLRLYKELIRN